MTGDLDNLSTTDLRTMAEGLQRQGDHNAAHFLRAAAVEIDHLREALRIYGDSVRMATSSREHLQPAIDRAMGGER
jgi:hypothetical protein